MARHRMCSGLKCNWLEYVLLQDLLRPIQKSMQLVRECFSQDYYLHTFSIFKSGPPLERSMFVSATIAGNVQNIKLVQNCTGFIYFVYSMRLFFILVLHFVQ